MTNSLYLSADTTPRNYSKINSTHNFVENIDSTTISGVNYGGRIKVYLFYKYFNDTNKFRYYFTVSYSRFYTNYEPYTVPSEVEILINETSILNSQISCGDSLYTNYQYLECNNDGSSNEITIQVNTKLKRDNGFVISKNLTRLCKSFEVFKIYLKNNDEWQTSVPRLKVNNIWKRCIVWKKINGEWKKGK